MAQVRPTRSPEEREDAFRVRHAVFCEEQRVPTGLERDELDDTATHFVALDDRGAVVGTARLHPYRPAGTGKVGRVAVLAAARGRGLGRALMGAVEEEAARSGFVELVLDAQVQVREFYRDLGYVARGEEFQDAGIPHVRMGKRLDRG